MFLSKEDRDYLRSQGAEGKSVLRNTFMLRVTSTIVALSLLGVVGLGSMRAFVGGGVSEVNATAPMNRQDALEEQGVIRYDSATAQADPPTEGAAIPPDVDAVPVDGETILLVGMDSREGRNSELGAGTVADVTGTRTDSIMLLHVPATGGTPYVVSFPRDLNVERPACVKWSGGEYDPNGATIDPASDVKINSVYRHGGPRCLVRVVQSVSQVKVTKFIAVDFAGFQDIVDAMGGVEVQTEGPINDRELGLIVPDAGSHMLDGEKALDFVRARKVEGQNMSDYDRIGRQQQFGRAVLTRVQSSEVLSSPSKLDDLARAMFASMSGEGISFEFVVSMLMKAGEIAGPNVAFKTIPTTGTLPNGNEGLSQTQANEMFAQLMG